MQFLLYDQEADNIFDPYELLKEERDIFRGRKLVCACNIKNQIEYKIRSNNRFYPAHNGLQDLHSPDCPKSIAFENCKKYNKAFEEKEDGTYIAHIKNINPPKRKEERVHDVSNENIFRRYFPSESQGEQTLYAFSTKLNMLAFEKMNYWKKSDYDRYLTANETIRKSYALFGDVFIEKMPLNHKIDLSNSKDKEFFYGVFEKYSKSQGNKLPRFFIKGKQQGIPVEEGLLRAASEKFQNTYGTKVSKLMERGYDIVVSGLRGKYGAYQICFFLVNHFGLFSESVYEVQMYNAICKYINDNDLKRKIVLFKPFEYYRGAYGEKYLEDGILMNIKTRRKAVVEVYGIENNEDYNRKILEKEDFLKDSNYLYLPWYANRGEELPMGKIEEVIQELLK